MSLGFFNLLTDTITENQYSLSLSHTHKIPCVCNGYLGVMLSSPTTSGLVHGRKPGKSKKAVDLNFLDILGWWTAVSLSHFQKCLLAIISIHACMEECERWMYYLSEPRRLHSCCILQVTIVCVCVPYSEENDQDYVDTGALSSGILKSHYNSKKQVFPIKKLWKQLCIAFHQEKQFWMTISEVNAQPAALKYSY